MYKLSSIPGVAGYKLAKSGRLWHVIRMGDDLIPSWPFANAAGPAHESRQAAIDYTHWRMSWDVASE